MYILSATNFFFEILNTFRDTEFSKTLGFFEPPDIGVNISTDQGMEEEYK